MEGGSPPGEKRAGVSLSARHAYIYSERRNGLTKYHRANEFPPHTRRATKNLGGLCSA